MGFVKKNRSQSRAEMIFRKSRWILGLSVVIFVFSYFNVEKLPGPEKIHEKVFENPTQTEIHEDEFFLKSHDKMYFIQPRYDYELSGLVVSDIDLEGDFFNIYYENDPYNTKDICVIWGGNAKRPDYLNVEFWTGIWTCYFRHDGTADFNPHEISNNHLLPADKWIAYKMKSIRVGDQVRLRGQLVDYSVNDQGWRRTSTVRTDDGNGACEVIYVTSLEILDRANVFWRWLQTLSGFTSVISFFVFVISYFWF